MCSNEGDHLSTYLDNHLFIFLNATCISFSIDSCALLFGVIFLLVQMNFIIKYLDNARKHEQGVRINSSLTFTYLYKQIVRFCWFFLQNMAYISKTFISLIFMLAPFSFPIHKVLFHPQVFAHVPLCPERSAPTLSWLACILQAPGWKTGPQRAFPCLSSLKKVFLPSPNLHSTYRHL